MRSSPPPKIETLNQSLERVHLARSELIKLLESRLSDYAQQELLWKDRSDHQPSPIRDTDPNMIQAFKHGLFLMQDIEKLLLIFKEFQNRHYSLKLLALPQTAYQTYNVVYNDILTHINELYTLASSSNLPSTSMKAIKGLSETLAGLSWNEMTVDKLKEKLQQAAPNLSYSVTQILNNYLHLDRPLIFQEAENRYRKPEATPPSPSKTGRTKAEWFPLLDPMREIMNGSRQLSTLMTDFMDNKYRDTVNKDELELIHKTQRALEKSQIKERGYFEYLSAGVDETSLSKSWKAIFNLMLTLDKLVSGLPRTPTFKDFGMITAHLMQDTVNSTSRILKGLKHLGSIDFSGLSPIFKVFTNQLINAMLFSIKENIYPKLKAFSDLMHQIEIQNNLRYDSLVTPQLRALLDPLESFALGQGISMPSPLEQRDPQLLNAAIESFKENSEALTQEKQLLDNIKILLQAYVDILPPFSAHTELLTALAKLKERPWMASPENKNALDALERRLLREVPLKQKIKMRTEADEKATPEWVDKLSESIVKDVERSSRWFYQRLKEDVVAGYAEMGQWPPQDIASIQAIVNKVRKDIAQTQNEGQENLRALMQVEQAKRMPNEYALRVLHQEGLNHFMRATMVADNQPELNLYQKRRLAVLAADLRREDRDAALAKPHVRALEFCYSSEAQDLVEMLWGYQPELAKSLALELSLAGFVPEERWMFKELLQIEEKQQESTLMRVLDHLEAEQVLDLIQDPSRAKLLQKVFNIELKEGALTKGELLQLCLQAWQAPLNGAALKEKVGSFAGRLSHADSEIAALVFASPEGKAMIKSSDRAIYHEALVNTFNLPPYREMNASSYDSFLRQWSAVMQTIHAVMNPEGKPFSPNDIVGYYQNSPLALCELLDQFMKQRLSANSQAEKQLKHLFSSLVLVHGREGEAIRDKMLEEQVRSSGFSQAGYLKWLIPEVGPLYWQTVNEDLFSLKNQAIFELKEKRVEIKEEREEWFSYINKQEERLNTLLKSESDPKRFPIFCRYLKQELEALRESAESKLEYIKAKERSVSPLSSSSAFFDPPSPVLEHKNSVDEAGMKDLVTLINNSLSDLKGEVVAYNKSKQKKHESKNQDAKSKIKDAVALKLLEYTTYMDNPKRSDHEKLERTREFMAELPRLREGNEQAVSAYNVSRSLWQSKASSGRVGEMLDRYEKALGPHIEKLTFYIPKLKRPD